MLVVHASSDPLSEQAAAGFQLDSVGPAHQRVGDQDLSTALGVTPIAIGDPLAFQMGVDRHLGVPPSTDRWDEIERHRAALAAHQRRRLLTDIELEIPINHSVTGYAVGLRLPRHCRTADRVS